MQSGRICSKFGTSGVEPQQTGPAGIRVTSTRLISSSTNRAYSALSCSSRRTMDSSAASLICSAVIASARFVSSRFMLSVSGSASEFASEESARRLIDSQNWNKRTSERIFQDSSGRHGDYPSEVARTQYRLRASQGNRPRAMSLRKLHTPSYLGGRTESWSVMGAEWLLSRTSSLSTSCHSAGLTPSSRTSTSSASQQE